LNPFEINCICSSLGQSEFWIFVEFGGKWKVRGNSKSASGITRRMRKIVSTRSCRLLVRSTDLPRPTGKPKWSEVKRSEAKWSEVKRSEVSHGGICLLSEAVSNCFFTS
jgi:hypothetical protein